MNQRYNNLRDTLGDPEQKVTESQEELADQEGCLQEILILNSSLLKLDAARHADQDKHRRQMTSLKKELTSAIASSKNADNQAKSHIANVKSEFAARQSASTQELTRTKKDLYPFMSRAIT